MSLLLCRQEQVKHPLYIESLGIHIHSSQELCYVIYHHPLLGLDGLIDSVLLEFLRNELDMGFTALKLERWLRSGENPDEALVILLQECDYYTNAEINRFKQQLTAIRKLPKVEFDKERADYLFGQKQYGRAVAIYRDILERETDGKLDERFMGRVWYNLGSTYARLFRFDQALEALENAYEFLKDPAVVRKLYLVTKLDSGITLPERYLELFTEEDRETWEKELSEAREQAGETKAVKDLEELFEKDSIKRVEGAVQLLKEWKREYRSMV